MRQAAKAKTKLVSVRSPSAKASRMRIAELAMAKTPAVARNTGFL
jgi:hypothetical protein